MADVTGRLDLSVVPTLICADGELPGFDHYDDVLTAAAPGPLDGEREGREMLYSSGTTGHPKGYGNSCRTPRSVTRGQRR